MIIYNEIWQYMAMTDRPNTCVFDFERVFGIKREQPRTVDRDVLLDAN